MFTAPPEATLEWNDAAVEGSFRFLRRVWNFGVAQADAQSVEIAGQSFGKAAQALRREVHTVLRQIDYDYQRMQYNTVVSGAMKLLNAVEGFKPDGSPGDAAALREGFGILLRCLYPATPHLTHQLWLALGYDKAMGDLLDAPWPVVDVGALTQDEVELMLQVNGKLRGKLLVPAEASKDEIEKLALACDDFVKFAEGAPAKRVIVVPGRLVNVVI
jgi:leucyl-tRNA synthetase